MKIKQITSTTYAVTDEETNAVCTFTGGQFNSSQKWNFDNVTTDDVLELASAARRVGDFVATSFPNLV